MIADSLLRTLCRGFFPLLANAALFRVLQWLEPVTASPMRACTQPATSSHCHCHCQPQWLFTFAAAFSRWKYTESVGAAFWFTHTGCQQRCVYTLDFSDWNTLAHTLVSLHIGSHTLPHTHTLFTLNLKDDIEHSSSSHSNRCRLATDSNAPKSLKSLAEVACWSRLLKSLALRDR